MVPYTLNGRLWDHLLIVGPEVMFRCAVAILTLSEGILLRCPNRESLLKQLSKSACVVSADEMISTAWSVPLDDEVIDRIDAIFKNP